MPPLAPTNATIRPRALALFSPSRDPRDRLKQLLARNRLQQIFAASAAHRLDDQLRLRIAGDRENRYLRKAGVDFLGRHSGADSIAVKIDRQMSQGALRVHFTGNSRSSMK